MNLTSQSSEAIDVSRSGIFSGRKDEFSTQLPAARRSCPKEHFGHGIGFRLCDIGQCPALGPRSRLVRHYGYRAKLAERRVTKLTRNLSDPSVGVAQTTGGGFAKGRRATGASQRCCGRGLDSLRYVNRGCQRSFGARLPFTPERRYLWRRPVRRGRARLSNRTPAIQRISRALVAAAKDSHLS
jgi:hypothetical protein